MLDDLYSTEVSPKSSILKSGETSEASFYEGLGEFEFFLGENILLITLYLFAYSFILFKRAF